MPTCRHNPPEAKPIAFGATKGVAFWALHPLRHVECRFASTFVGDKI